MTFWLFEPQFCPLNFFPYSMDIHRVSTSKNRSLENHSLVMVEMHFLAGDWVIFDIIDYWHHNQSHTVSFIKYLCINDRKKNLEVLCYLQCLEYFGIYIMKQSDFSVAKHSVTLTWNSKIPLALYIYLLQSQLLYIVFRIYMI